jgi:hypothetical protein
LEQAHVYDAYPFHLPHHQSRTRKTAACRLTHNRILNFPYIIQYCVFSLAKDIFATAGGSKTVPDKQKAIAYGPKTSDCTSDSLDSALDFLASTPGSFDFNPASLDDIPRFSGFKVKPVDNTSLGGKNAPGGIEVNKGCRIWYSVIAPGETPPAHPEELRESFYARRMKALVEFGFASSGKTVWFAAQVENDGRKGEWGRMVSALVP